MFRAIYLQRIGFILCVGVYLGVVDMKTLHAAFTKVYMKITIRWL